MKTRQKFTEISNGIETSALLLCCVGNRYYDRMMQELGEKSTESAGRVLQKEFCADRNAYQMHV